MNSDFTKHIKTGSIFKLGNSRLMCGDSTNVDDVRRLMEGTKAEILFTSPPYSDIREYEKGTDVSIDKIKKFVSVYSQYANYLCVNLGIKRRNNEIDPYWNEYIREAEECGLKLLAWNVWDKTQATSIGMSSAFIPIRHEFIFVFGVKPKKINLTWQKKHTGVDHRKFRSVRQSNGELKKTTQGPSHPFLKKMESVICLLPEYNNDIRLIHPATFPVTLPSEYIKSLSNEGDCVIEPFCGSGTTIIAAERLKRRCFAMEISPIYCEYAIKRYESATGSKAEILYSA